MALFGLIKVYHLHLRWKAETDIPETGGADGGPCEEKPRRKGSPV